MIEARHPAYGDDPYALYQEKIMLKRLVMIGLVGISLTTILAAKVNAQIAGWAGFGFSEFTFVVALKEVKDPTKFPSVLSVKGTLNSVECFCFKPNSHEVFLGQAGVQKIDAAAEVTKPRPERLTFQLFQFPLDGYEELACDPGFKPLPGSCATDDVTLVMHWYRCTGDPKIDSEPCFDKHGELTVDREAPIDEAATHCTLDHVERDAKGRPKHGQKFDCPGTDNRQHDEEEDDHHDNDDHHDRDHAAAAQ
jgi:hypothetical protein